jgi:hypothetical protein
MRDIYQLVEQYLIGPVHAGIALCNSHKKGGIVNLPFSLKFLFLPFSVL